jgi:hypothetical protein
VNKPEGPFAPGQPLPKLLSVKQAAYMLGCSEDEVRGLLAAGLLGQVLLGEGRYKHIPLGELDRFVAERTEYQRGTWEAA